MTYFLFFSAILVGLIFKKSKIAGAYILLSLYTLSAFNYHNADYYAYTISYRHSSSSEFRYFGYSVITNFFFFFLIPYEDYLKIIFVIILVMLYFAVNLITNKPNLVLALFTIFSFGIDAIQIKAFSSEVLSLLSIVIIIKLLSLNHDEKHRKYLYIIAFALSIAGSLLHYSGIYYVAIEIVYLLIVHRKKIKRSILVILGLFALMLYSGLLPIVLRIGHSVGVISNIDYLSQWVVRKTRFGFIITFIGVFLLLASIAYKGDDSSDTPLQSVIREFLFTSVLILPLLIMNWTYDRLLRVYAILLYAYFANKRICAIISFKQVSSILVLLSFVSYMFYIDIFMSYEGTLGAIFKYSLLFN